MLVAVGCGTADPSASPEAPEAGTTASAASGRQAATATREAPTPTPATRFQGFDLDLSEGAFWEYRWAYTDRSCAQGSGCSTAEDDGVFAVTLGTERVVEGVTVYEVSVTGKSAVSLPKENRDFAPRWRYLGADGNRIVGSNGSTLTTIFDGATGKWAGSGYFTERFESDELLVAAKGSLSSSYEIADWPGVKQGPWVYVGRAASQSQCEMIEGLRICPREETFDFSESEYYRAGIGPVAYRFSHSASFSGGSFFSSYQTTEWVALVGSSLRGDVARVAATPTATPPSRPTRPPASRPLPVSATDPVFGPVEGSLPHDPTDDLIPDFSSGVSFEAAVAEATFENPNTPAWSYGFSFRQSEEETFHGVYVTSGGQWIHFARGGSVGQQLEPGGGATDALALGPGQSNHLMVAFTPAEAWFFVNGEFVAELNLSQPAAAQAAGDIRLFGGVNVGDETAGEATPFSGFTVRPLKRVSGPSDADLRHAPGDGDLPAAVAGVNVANAVVDVTFANPRPTTRRDWAHALLLRATGSEFHTVVLSGSGEWLYAQGGDIVRAAERTSAIDTAATGTNRVQIVAIQDNAWCFVNGRYLGRLDLRGGSPAGDVEAVGALDDKLEIAGAVTSISDFTVWSFD